jgi:hypothetical protein
MPKDKLNVRQERFARAYIVTHGNARKAYVLAGYEARTPITPRQSAPVDSAACRLLKHERVKRRIERLQAMAAKRNDVTVDSILGELESARELAMQIEQPAAAVQASNAKAKVAGLIVDKREDVSKIDQMTADELRQYLKDNRASLEAAIKDGTAIEHDSPKAIQ